MKIQSLVYFVPLIIICLAMIFFLISSCTISFQNISTHGTAQDLVDENQSPTNDPNFSIPVNP